MSNDISKLPKWAQDRIAKLEEDLRLWQDRYVELAKWRDPTFVRLIAPPADIKIFPPGPTPPTEPHLPPGVYAYMCPFPSEASTKPMTGTVWTGVASSPPTGKEP